MSVPAATREIRDLPGPPQPPLLGNLHQTWWLPPSHEVERERLAFMVIPEGRRIELRQRVPG